MLYTSGPRSAGGPAAGRSARARALQTRGHPYQAWRRAGRQPASQHRPTSDGSAEAPCHSKAEKLVIFLKKKKKKKYL